jgi:hypothetical protein
LEFNIFTVLGNELTKLTKLRKYTYFFVETHNLQSINLYFENKKYLLAIAHVFIKYNIADLLAGLVYGV